MEVQLQTWNSYLPPDFTGCARRTIDLSGLTLGMSAYTEALDTTLYTTPMCAETMQTYHVAHILLLMDKPQEPQRIRILHFPGDRQGR